jgi:hypothetical protein
MWRYGREPASFAFCKEQTGVHCFKALPLSGEGLSPFSAARHRLQDLFVVVEMAIALVLLVGPG